MFEYKINIKQISSPDILRCKIKKDGIVLQSMSKFTYNGKMIIRQIKI
jgi:hypothetical protein